MNNTFKKRIDELGRIVIPKQIRNDFKISNFDELNIFVKDDNIVIKKNIGLQKYKEKFDRFLQFYNNYNEFYIIITDKEKIISTNFNSVNNLNFINTIPYNEVINIDVYFYFKVSIIIDSNYVGDVIFISNSIFNKDNNQIKGIKDLLMDLIN